MKRLPALFVAAFAIACLIGCSQEQSTVAPPADTPDEESLPAEPTSATSSAEVAEPDEKTEPDDTSTADSPMTPEQLEAAIKEKNPNFSGEIFTQMGPKGIAAVGINDPAIENISPLAGLPLYVLDLHDCHISDVSVLQGMKLGKIDLSNTGVSDISVLAGMPLQVGYFNKTRIKDSSPLAGAPLEQVDFSDAPLENVEGLKGAPMGTLYLVNTKVKSVEPLRGGNLQSIWLNNAPLEDCSPLASNPVVSVTLAGTKVSDISCFKGHPTLQRLHIAETEVTDLTPLQWMGGLTRLIFTPNRIKKGIEYARQMPSIREIGTAFGTPEDEGKMFPPNQFWQMYDEGKFN